jgi:tetratricopeptide (TPR) repeat protein
MARAQAMNYLTGIAQSQSTLCTVRFLAGDLANVVSAGQAAIEAAERSGDLMIDCIVHQFMAWGEARRGEPEAAQRHLAQAAALLPRFGGQLFHSDWFAAAEAERALQFGGPAEALQLAQQAVQQAQRAGCIFAEGLAQRTWGQALWKAEGGRMKDERGKTHPSSREAIPHPSEAAEAHLAESLRLLELAEARLEAARTHVAWGLLCRDRQDDAVARPHFEQAAAQFEASGLADELAQTRRWLAELSA